MGIRLKTFVVMFLLLFMASPCFSAPIVGTWGPNDFVSMGIWGEDFGPGGEGSPGGWVDAISATDPDMDGQLTSVAHWALIGLSNSGPAQPVNGAYFTHYDSGMMDIWQGPWMGAGDTMYFLDVEAFNLSTPEQNLDGVIYPAQFQMDLYGVFANFPSYRFYAHLTGWEAGSDVIGQEYLGYDHSGALLVDLVEISQVPVPAAVWLLGSGLLGLLGIRRKMKN